MRCNRSTLTTANSIDRPAEVSAHNRIGGAQRRIAGNAYGIGILLRAAHMVRDVSGRGHVVELSGRILLAGPALATIERYVPAAVIAFDHAA